MYLLWIIRNLGKQYCCSHAKHCVIVCHSGRQKQLHFWPMAGYWHRILGNMLNWGSEWCSGTGLSEISSTQWIWHRWCLCRTECVELETLLNWSSTSMSSYCSAGRIISKLHRKYQSKPQNNSKNHHCKPNCKRLI